MKILKRIGIVLGILVFLFVLVVAGLYWKSSSMLSKNYDVQPESVRIPSDSASLARGKHWSDVQCAACHGDNFGGTNFFEDPSLGYIHAPNLTSGKGGIGSVYKDADWIRSIRHGVRPDGRGLLIMPAGDFFHINDMDLGCIIAYLKTVPAVDNEIKGYDLKPLTKVLMAIGAFGDVMGAEIVDHTTRPGVTVEALTEAYGGYLVRVSGCRTCHGKELAGGKDPNPAAPPGPNLTPGGMLDHWNDSQFIKTIRTGITPEGRPLQGLYMPWPFYGRMTDDELKSMFLYLQSLPKSKSAV